MEQPKIMQIAHKGSGGQKGFIHCTEGIVGCCTATDYKDPKYILELTGGGTHWLRNKLSYLVFLRHRHTRP